MATLKTVETIASLGPGVLARRRLMLTLDRNHVVTETDAGAAFLLAAPGQRIDPGDVVRYGLHTGDIPVAVPDAPRPAPVATPPRADAAPASPETRTRGGRDHR